MRPRQVMFLPPSNAEPTSDPAPLSFQAAPVLLAGYVVSASRIADRRMILAGYRLADLLTRLVATNYYRAS